MTSRHSPEHRSAHGWRAFWDRGGWWKFVLAVVGYLAVYLGAQVLLAPLLRPYINQDNPLGEPLSVLLGLVLPLVIGAIALVLFTASIGWLPTPLWGKQPLRGRGWMWPAPILVVVASVAHFAGADYGRYEAGTVLAILVAGLLVGFTEEMVTRGIGVSLLRRARHKEWAVMALSSLVFALMHLTNLLSGQSLATVLPTVLYTFGFGISMYLTLRVGGRLVWPIMLHAITDPATMLASGGIDQSVAGTQNGWLIVAAVATAGYGVWALVAFIATRADAEGRAELSESATRGLTVSDSV